MQQPNYIHTTEIHNTDAANEVLPYIFEKFSPKNVIDVGCGTGTWLSVAKNLGARIKGIDGNFIDQALLEINEDEFTLHDLTIPFNPDYKYDLTICLEVVEHLPESAAGTIIKTLTSTSDVILFSAAIPNQGGQNHINEQWPTYWQQFFEAEHFYPVDMLRSKFWNNPNIQWWYKQNMLIYATKGTIKHRNLEIVEHVNGYVYPELFESKIGQILNLQTEIHGNKNGIRFLRSIKHLVRSLIK